MLKEKEKKKKRKQLGSKPEEALWSVRMRASRRITRSRSMHVSGAEGLYREKAIERILRDYGMRAMNHPRGMPDEVLFTIERMREKPVKVPLLPVRTCQCDSPLDARAVLRAELFKAGISRKAIEKGIKVVTGRTVMRGASLIRALSGVRIEPDRGRGVRVSRIGIEGGRERALSRMLSREGINTATVREALILASKVASCDGVLAELCMSDDPDYTTGYIASRTLGYVRIPMIKERGDSRGGRIFFMREEADAEPLIAYLENKPVIVC
ncbi:MAG TPA: 6-carboxyhexanoate--CoA ligase [Thermodesulfovibrionales bacterium]|nr:6-carboxyhexanoate--CoA ligase [Thermodesulfovibrionales bacterium]